MRRGQGAGAVEVKGKKSEVGGAQSAGQRWHWGQWAHLGSSWARIAAFTLME